MRRHLLFATAAFAAAVSARSAIAQDNALVREARIPVGGTVQLYTRVAGSGPPVIVLHGGPDFDHRYLLPDLDQLKEGVRLIYYDQRGRGRSAENVQAEDVSLETDLADLDRVRAHFGLDSVVLLGHSWGALLALEYAVRHPERVTRLILMNPVPVTASHVAAFRTGYATRLGHEMARQQEILNGAAYRSGDPDAVAARYRLHFRSALTRPQDYERLMTAMQAGFRNQGAAGIVKARAVEDRLMLDTWQRPGYDLLPQLKRLRIPTLVITGANDFVPIEAAATPISRAIPGATLITIASSGHFAYLERPADVHKALGSFLRASTAKSQ